MKYFLSSEQKQFVLDEYCVYVLTGEMNTIFSLTEALYLIEVAIDQMGLAVPRFNISDEITFPENNTLFGRYRTTYTAITNLTGLGSSILPDVIKNHFFQLYQDKITSVTVDMANTSFDTSALAKAFINSGVRGTNPSMIIDDHLDALALTGQGVIGGRSAGKTMFNRIDLQDLIGQKKLISGLGTNNVQIKSVDEEEDWATIKNKYIPRIPDEEA